MKFLKIQNKGELDIRLLSLMGGTTKSDDPLKIGQWGSGLKYSIAWLLRNNITFKVFIGNREVTFNTSEVSIRDNTFDVVVIDGEKTSLTTNMGGEEWKPWMIVREILCNAIDEEEYSYETTTSVNGLEGYTTFYIQITPDISEVVDNWREYFIFEETPMFEDETVAIYHNPYKGIRIYKQGVLIKKDERDFVKKALFRYDIKDAEINELRELKGSIGFGVLEALSRANEKVITYFFENISKAYYEGSDEVPYSYFWKTFNESWKNVLGEAKLVNEEYVEKLIENNVITDIKDYIVVPDNVYSFLNKEFEGFGALVSINSHEYYINDNPKMLDRLKQAFAVLETCGYTLNPDLEWKIGVFIGARTMAVIDIKNKLVVVSEAMLAKPLFEVISMVVEENEHYVTKYNDCSREFQTHFINKYVRELLKNNGIEM